MAYVSTNPFTEQVIRTFAEYTDAEMEAALATSHALAKSEWATAPVASRTPILSRLAELLEERGDDLSRTMALEMGKPLAQALGELQICIGIARYYAEKAEAFLAPVTIETNAGDAHVEHHPIGVLVAIEPWNFPIYQLIRVVAPAIAVGNPVLMKHAEIVPQCAQMFADLVLEAGAPEGACTNLYISIDQAAALIADDRVQGVALTGSERAGSAVAANASRNLKKSTLELGGSDVFAVLDDADVEKAAAVGAAARLANAGQVCTGSKRFVLHESIAERFLELFRGHFAAVVQGDPLDPATTMGPLCSQRAVETLADQVERSVASGATVMAGGHRPDRQGYFYEPTILTGVTPDNPTFYEEFFGPVAQVFVVKDDDELVALANDSRFGLGGAIFSRDVDRARRLAERIETGMVFINMASRSLPELPFGGVKRSGFGRELSDLGIMEFVNRKLVVAANA
jgi:succinate-semialdehyde dehydrogenase / glutarate-semialdehyde dehydrogenase